MKRQSYFFIFSHRLYKIFRFIRRFDFTILMCLNMNHFITFSLSPPFQFNLPTSITTISKKAPAYTLSFRYYNFLFSYLYFILFSLATVYALARSWRHMISKVRQFVILSSWSYNSYVGKIDILEKVFWYVIY